MSCAFLCFEQALFLQLYSLNPCEQGKALSSHQQQRTKFLSTKYIIDNTSDYQKVNYICYQYNKLDWEMKSKQDIPDKNTTNKLCKNIDQS